MLQLEDTTPECSNLWMKSLTDKYKCRTERVSGDFAATCRFVYGKRLRCFVPAE